MMDKRRSATYLFLSFPKQKKQKKARMCNRMEKNNLKFMEGEWETKDKSFYYILSQFELLPFQLRYSNINKLVKHDKGKH
uniref:Uncharacterized protein n=1 Tax=Timema monikensis TaxID=170555 RepID=A0A7R9E5S0_9NEOP|nr:unnamed protein product [Timema monikensis]